jgi:hypothetical protein
VDRGFPQRWVKGIVACSVSMVGERASCAVFGGVFLGKYVVSAVLLGLEQWKHLLLNHSYECYPSTGEVLEKFFHVDFQPRHQPWLVK